MNVQVSLDEDDIWAIGYAAAELRHRLNYFDMADSQEVAYRRSVMTLESIERRYASLKRDTLDKQAEPRQD